MPKPRRSALEDNDYLDQLAEEAAQARSDEPNQGKGKPGHAGQKGTDRTGRAKMTFDLSPERQTMLREIADTESVALSDVVEAAIVSFHNQWQEKEDVFYLIRERARSLRVLWKLIIPDDWRI